MATQTTSNTLQGKTGINAGEPRRNHHQPRHTLRPSQRQGGFAHGVGHPACGATCTFFSVLCPDPEPRERQVQ